MPIPVPCFLTDIKNKKGEREKRKRKYFSENLLVREDLF
jgi:hypothetical protein